MNKTLAVALLLSAVAATAATPPTGRLRLEPEQPVYFVGQDVQLIVELDLVDVELGGNLSLDGLPDASWARYGAFHEIAGETFTADGRLTARKRFATNIRLLRDGRYELSPVLGGTTAERRRRGFMTVVSQAPFRVALSPATMRVDPLPAPAPNDFHGGIGQFRLSATVSPDSASPGDLINLRWTLEGYGNLEISRLPSCSDTPGFRAYPPREESRDPGRRLVVSQVLVPQVLEANQVPELEFSIFDTGRGRYVRLSAGPFRIDLKPRPTEPRDPRPDAVWRPTVSAPEGGAAPKEGAPFEFPRAAKIQPLLVLLGGLALALFLFTSVVRRSRWAAVLLSCTVLAATFALRQALLRHRQRESLTIRVETQSRLCPSAASRVLGRIPEGAPVRLLEKTDRWLRVEFEGASGWVPADTVSAETVRGVRHNR